MMTSRILSRRFLLVLLALVPVMGLALPAHANDALDQAKTAGLVGERPDGLLGAVVPPSPATAALIKSVNDRRLEVFRGIAAKNGQSLATVQAVSGDEFMARTPAGQYVMDAAGNWKKK